MDFHLFDSIRRLRDHGYVVIERDRIHELQTQCVIQDPSLIYEKVNVKQITETELVRSLSAELVKNDKLLHWRYSQDADVGGLIIRSSLMAIEPRWKTGLEPHL